jgi:hypothetical protein
VKKREVRIHNLLKQKYKNRIIRRISGSKGIEVTAGYTRMYNKYIHNGKIMYERCDISTKF